MIQVAIVLLVEVGLFGWGIMLLSFGKKKQGLVLLGFAAVLAVFIFIAAGFYASE